MELYRLIGYISLGLLFCFFCYWNYDNYQRSKQQLITDLETQARLAYAEKLDSTLMTVIEIFGSNHNFDKDTILNFSGAPGQITEFLDHSFVSFTSSLNSLGDAVHFDQAAKLELRDFKGSIKIDGNMDTMSFSLENPEPAQIAFDKLRDNIDHIFSENLKEKGLPMTFETTRSKVDSSQVNSIIIDLSFDNFSDSTNTAIFSDYRSYLFKKNARGMLVSVLLYIMIFWAFYMIYKSWNEQIRLNRVKTEFVSNMTHELKTPIATVGVALEALTEFGAIKDPAKTKEYLSISKHELNRLNILVDKVLKMSKFDSDSPLLKKELIDIRILIDEILNSMKLYFDKHDVQLRCHIEGNDFLIEGDRVHITNVIYNLLDNAIKYSVETPEILLSLSSHGSEVQCSVEDKGIGIHSDHIADIFRRFYRVPTNDRHDVKGHGLGLSYVQEIIEKHNGYIKVSSVLDEGTIFMVSLPKYISDA